MKTLTTAVRNGDNIVFNEHFHTEGGCENRQRRIPVSELLGVTLMQSRITGIHPPTSIHTVSLVFSDDTEEYAAGLFADPEKDNYVIKDGYLAIEMYETICDLMGWAK